METDTAILAKLNQSDIKKFTELGIPLDLLSRAGVERVTDREAREKFGISGHGDMAGIVFPYRNPKDDRRWTARVRRDNPEIENGKPARRYISPFGDRKRLYFPPGSSELLSDPDATLLLLESEKAALALSAWAKRVNRKLLVVATGGCWGWRGRIGKLENSNGKRVDEKGPLPDLGCARKGRKVIILLDANASTNPDVSRARDALVHQVQRQGANVLIADLPVERGINGPDDYLAARGDTAMVAVLDAARPPGVDWEPPVPFGALSTPHIPATLLPSGPLRDFVSALSATTQSPSAGALLLSLAAIACAAQRKAVISPRKSGDYFESLSLWVFLVQPPGERKTAQVNGVREPISEWERDEQVRLAKEIAENYAARSVADRRLSHLEALAGKEDSPSIRKQLVEQIAAERLAVPDEIHPPQLWTGDVTPERLQDLLATHKSAAVFSDEGGVFDVICGRYSEGVYIDVFLQSWSGADAKTDRISRKAHLIRPGLSFGISVQPRVVSDMAEGAKRALRGRGMLGRFLYAWPESNVGRRDVTEDIPIAGSVREGYRQLIRGLLDWNPVEDPVRFVISPDALKLWLAFAHDIETRQGEYGDLYSVQDWSSKLPGQALRIAGLLHLAQGLRDQPIVERASIEAALDICELLVPHAQATLESIQDDAAVADAKIVLRWILHNGEASFKKSDCLRAHHGRFKHVTRLESALAVLSARNWISGPHKADTRKPTLWFAVNPQAFSAEAPQ